MQRTVEGGPGMDASSERAAFHYGADRYEISLDEAKRLMIEVQEIMNGDGWGLVRVEVGEAEAVFLISGGALLTFHVPSGTTYYDDEDCASSVLEQ
jgi:hypothetical protein